MDADAASSEGEMPDIIPPALIEEHGHEARRTVARSVGPTAIEVLSAWGSRLADLAMVVAAIGIVAALAFLIVAFPILGIPLAGVALVVVAVALVVWVVRRRGRQL